MKYFFLLPIVLVCLAAGLLCGCQRILIDDCANTTDKDGCCAELNKDTIHVECVGSWQYLEGRCKFVCGAKPCPADLKSCPDGTTLPRDPQNNCEFPSCPSPCSSSDDRDKCCRTGNKGTPAPLRCPGTWHFVAEECKYDCFQAVFSQCGADRACQKGRCTALAGSAYCLDDPCEFAGCKENEECRILESYPLQTTCSGAPVVGADCGTVSPDYRAECCKKKIDCLAPKAAVYSVDSQECECTTLQCIDYCSAREFLVYDVNSGKCICSGGSAAVGVVDYALSLRFGQTAFFDEANTYISFLEVSEDSRCPKDVQCVWAGRVGVLLGVEQEGSLLPVVLSKGPGGTESVAVKGYNLLLVSVSPEPVSTKQLQWHDYTITVLLEKR